MDIETVQYMTYGGGWIVNGTVSVPEPSRTDEDTLYVSPETQAVLDWIADGGKVSPGDPPPAPLTAEEEIEALPPLWKAALEAYIEQQPRDRRAIINNIKRHLK